MPALSGNVLCNVLFNVLCNVMCCNIGDIVIVSLLYAGVPKMFGKTTEWVSYKKDETPVL